MYVWGARDRLCWPRMMWLEHNYNEPEYEMHRQYRARKRLRRLRFGLQAQTRCDNINTIPPKIGRWPVLPRWHRPAKRT